MRTKLGALAAVLAGLILAAPAGANNNPKALIDLDCEGRHAVASFDYSGMYAGWKIAASQTLKVSGGATKTKVYRFTGGSGSDTMSVRLGQGRHRVTASTVARAGAGRVKASASKSVRCGSPPPPPPKVATSAKLVGPCGDPMYRAVFVNEGDRAETFKWSYVAFGVGRVTLVRTIAAGRTFVTGYKHVAGSTWTTVRAHGDLLLRRLTAPGGDYPACH